MKKSVKKLLCGFMAISFGISTLTLQAASPPKRGILVSKGVQVGTLVTPVQRGIFISNTPRQTTYSYSEADERVLFGVLFLTALTAVVLASDHGHHHGHYGHHYGRHYGHHHSYQSFSFGYYSY